MAKDRSQCLASTDHAYHAPRYRLNLMVCPFTGNLEWTRIFTVSHWKTLLKTHTFHKPFDCLKRAVLDCKAFRAGILVSFLPPPPPQLLCKESLHCCSKKKT